MCSCMSSGIEKIMECGLGAMSALTNWECIESAYFKHTTEIVLSHLSIPVVVTGVNKKGKKVKKEFYYPIKFCPFCGKSIDEDGEEK